ncbi:MAG: heavy metal translocating P-type ATPase [Planctomycetes bacterium]|nr:heavy metal translocating P-type ATPase [Planctomycetota bacterium]
MPPDLLEAQPSAAPPIAECLHCRAPVPPGQGEFCCAGCATVHEILRAQGLDQGYYRVLARSEGEAVPARPSDRTYAELDEASFAARHVRRVEVGRREAATTALYLEGVHCAACVWLVERLPRVLPGVLEARLDLGRQVATVTWDPAVVALSEVARRLDGFGYPVHPHRAGAAREARRREDRAALSRIALAGAIAGNVMLLSFALYGGAFSGMEARFEAFFRWGCLLLTVPSYLGPGRVFLKGALGALRARALHMDLPIAIGLTAGTVGGVWNTVAGSGEVYFDAVAVLIFLLLAGRWLERRAHRRASDAAELLAALAPTSARLVRGDEVREVPIEALAPGDLVEVRAGDALPVDGAVEAGASDLDLSLLTGESAPQPVAPGQRVHAGTLNLTARLVVKVTEAGEATRVGRLARLVEEHAARRAPIVRVADRLAGRFVAVVLLLAVATVAAWWAVDPKLALDHAVALLVVACPCALGLATPLAVSVAVGRAARGGIVVKGGDVLERLSRPGRMWLDKTGTLTEGRARLLEFRGHEAVRPALLALQAHSAHPLARGFREAWPDLAPAALDGPVARGRAGLEGRVGGADLRVGAPAWVLEVARAPSWIEPFVEAQVALARTPVLVARDGDVVAAASFGDRLRPDARAAVDRLVARGWQVGILSGDHPDVVRAAGQALGLLPDECLGGLSPEEKAALVERSRREGPVVMVGDGVNDAAALAAATVGVGVHGGAEAALGAADVFVTRPGVAPVADLLGRADRALTTIRRNLGLSLAYNVVGAALAVGGVITPWMAALLMPLSSLTVIFSSTRQGGDA